MEKIEMDWNWLQSVSSVVADKNSKRLHYTRKEEVIYDVRCRDEGVFFLITVEVKVEMALKVENYNYTKELQNMSSLFFSSFPFLRPPSFPLPTLYHFSHPLTLFSPSSFPPLSLDSYLSPHCLFVPIIPPNDLPTVFLPISHLVNRFNAFNARV